MSSAAAYPCPPRDRGSRTGRPSGGRARPQEGRHGRLLRGRISPCTPAHGFPAPSQSAARGLEDRVVREKRDCSSWCLFRSATRTRRAPKGVRWNVDGLERIRPEVPGRSRGSLRLHSPAGWREDEEELSDLLERRFQGGPGLLGRGVEDVTPDDRDVGLEASDVGGGGLDVDRADFLEQAITADSGSLDPGPGSWPSARS